MIFYYVYIYKCIYIYILHKYPPVPFHSIAVPGNFLRSERARISLSVCKKAFAIAYKKIVNHGECKKPFASRDFSVTVHVCSCLFDGRLDFLIPGGGLDLVQVVHHSSFPCQLRKKCWVIWLVVSSQLK